MKANRNFASVVQPLHEHSERQLIERARRQFGGGDNEFSELLRAYAALAPKEKWAFLARHGFASNDDDSSTGNQLSLAITEATGAFLRNLVLTMRPNLILELGSSCGVSTLYFADALRMLGKGRMIATEFDAWKIQQLRSNLASAALAEWVDVRQGDVMQILAEAREPVDLAFIDIWATGYLDAFKLLRPLLRPGSVVLADNMFTAEPDVQAFKQYLMEDAGLSTTTLEFESGIEFTVVL